MPQVIRIKRNVTSTAGPAALDPGELGYTGSGAVHNLYIGDGTGTVQNLVNPTRQVEIAGAQTITGVKTFDAVGKINIIGGPVGSVLQSADPVTGALAFGPAVAAAQLYIGSLDATAGTIAFTTASGVPGPGLPAAAPANAGWYIICNVSGSTVPANVPAGTYTQGDWVLSNGAAWNHLDFGGTAVSTASDVGVVAPLVGPTVQDELESLVTNKVDLAGDTMTGLLVLSGPPTAALGAATKAYVDPKVTGPATSTTGNLMTFADATGKLAADSGLLATSLGDVKGPATAVIDRIATYTDATGKVIKDGGKTIAELGDVKGPALSADLNVAVFSGLTGKLLADSGRALPAVFGDVVGPAASGLDRIATYSDLTGKVIKDGGKTIAELGDVKGPALSTDLNVAVFSGATGKLIADSGKALPATFGDVVGPATSVLDNIATYADATGKVIKNSGTLISSLLTSVSVTAPITGDGTAATPLGFSGIVIAANSTTSLIGNGLTATPLDLVLVDGGVYT